MSDLTGVAQFAVTSYLLYLRISGQFHVVVGILCLFGFNLPPTHNLYFMAAGFNDLWRRVNVYWKDFMLKTTYYPVAMRWRSWGPSWSAVATIFVVIGATWALHSYQWFWLRGWFPVTEVEGIFWGTLAVGMAATTWVETKRRRIGSLSRDSQTFRAVAMHSASAVVTFLVMSALWSLLASATVEDWLVTVSAASNWDLAQITTLVAATLALFLLFVAIRFARGPSHAYAPSFRRSALETVGLTLVLVGLGALGTRLEAGSTASAVLSSLERDRLNRRDADLMERGYYEHVLAMDRYLAQLWRTELQRPRGWADRPEDFIVWTDGDPFRSRLRPSSVMRFKDATVTSNRWGMRDRDYELTPARGTIRYALLGGSGEFGTGVDDDAVFEALVEERLNRERPFEGVERYEILNFSLPGHHLMRRLAALPRVLDFEPDFVILPSIGPRERRKVADRIAGAIAEGVEIPFPVIRDVIERAGIRRGMSEVEIEKRLKPWTGEIVEWAYREIATRCRERGATPLWLYLPIARVEARPDQIRKAASFARRSGFLTLSIADAYEGVERRDLEIAPWDGHPNARAHALLADALYPELVALGPPAVETSTAAR